MEINVKKLAEKAKMKSPDLLTRSVGRKLYKALEKLITISGEDEVIILDFSGIKVIDSSFIDEFIIKFIRNSSEEKNYYVKLRNLSSIGQTNTEAVLRSYLEFDSQKIVVMTEDICLNNNFFLGELDSVEKDIVNFLRVNKSALESDIIGLTAEEPEDVRKVLKRLSSWKVIRINEEGRYLPV